MEHPRATISWLLSVTCSLLSKNNASLLDRHAGVIFLMYIHMYTVPRCCFFHVSSFHMDTTNTSYCLPKAKRTQAPSWQSFFFSLSFLPYMYITLGVMNVFKANTFIKWGHFRMVELVWECNITINTSIQLQVKLRYPYDQLSFQWHIFYINVKHHIPRWTILISFKFTARLDNRQRKQI